MGNLLLSRLMGAHIRTWCVVVQFFWGDGGYWWKIAIYFRSIYAMAVSARAGHVSRGKALGRGYFAACGPHSADAVFFCSLCHILLLLLLLLLLQFRGGVRARRQRRPGGTGNRRTLGASAAGAWM